MKFKDFLFENRINEAENTINILSTLKNIKSILDKIDVNKIKSILKNVKSFIKYSIRNKKINYIIDLGKDLNIEIEKQIKKLLEIKHEFKTNYLDDSIRVLMKVKETVEFHVQEERKKYQEAAPNRK